MKIEFILRERSLAYNERTIRIERYLPGKKYLAACQSSSSAASVNIRNYSNRQEDLICTRQYGSKERLK